MLEGKSKREALKVMGDGEQLDRLLHPALDGESFRVRMDQPAHRRGPLRAGRPRA